MLETRLLELQGTAFAICSTRAVNAHQARVLVKIKQQMVGAATTLKNFAAMA